MAGPPPFGDLGNKADELLRKDYCFDQMFVLKMPRSGGMSITAAGFNHGQAFVGGIQTMYKRGNTEVEVKADTHNNMFSTVTVNNLWPFSKADLNFILSDELSSKLHVQYLHRHAAIDSAITLNDPAPELELSATIGTKEFFVGGEVGYERATSSINKYTAGIGFNKPDLSAAVLLKHQGRTLTVSYIHYVSPFTSVAAELTRARYYFPNTFFSMGSAHVLDPCTVLKTRFDLNGSFRMLVQREWRPKSFITFCAEYGPKGSADSNYTPATRMGFKLELVP